MRQLLRSETHLECLDIANENDMLPLHTACSKGRLGNVKFLLEKHAEKMKKKADDADADADANADENDEGARRKAEVVNRLSKRGTAVHGAACGGHTEVVSFLIAAGADVEATDDGEWTPLFSASLGGHTDVVKLLMKHGADVEARDDEQGTALQVAARNKQLDAAKVLLEIGGANINTVDALLWTPLIAASFAGDDAMVSYFLFDQDADRHVVNNKGYSPLYAEEYPRVTELLLHAPRGPIL